MLQFKRKRISFALVLLFLAISCSPGTAQTQQQKNLKPVTPSQEIATQVVEKGVRTGEWDRILAQAKKEGKIVMFGTPGGFVHRALVEAFKSIGVDIEYVGGLGLSQKVINEYKAGINLVDVWLGGATDATAVLKPGGYLQSLKSVLLPEIADPKIWWRPENWPSQELLWVDKELNYILTFMAYPQSVLAVNTDLVRPGEVRSLADLLNPKWKGKIIMTDPTLPGPSVTTFRTVERVVGKDYPLQLVKQEPVILRDTRLAAEWLVHGKASI